MYRIYIYIYTIFSFENIGYFRYFQFLSSSLYIFLMWHIVTTFWFSVCVFRWLMTCVLSIFSVLDNFCQISPLHSNEVWMTRVLHLICNAHTHILLFGSNFHIILAMYVQMLDIYIYKILDIYDIFENITIFSNPANGWHTRILNQTSMDNSTTAPGVLVGSINVTASAVWLSVWRAQWTNEASPSQIETLSSDRNKKLIRRWDSERELSLRPHYTRPKNTIDSCIYSATDRFLQRSFTKFSEITQCNSHYAVQGHSRSPTLVPIESSYTP